MNWKWKVCFVLSILLVVAWGVQGWKLSRIAQREIVARDKAIAATARAWGASEGKLATERRMRAILEGRLAGMVAQLKMVDRGARVVEVAKTTATIKTVEQGHVTAATPATLASWDDNYHRFHLELPNGPLRRTQKFAFTGAVVRGIDGKHRFYKADLREYDPVTGDEIPGVSDGVTYKYEFLFGDEKAKPISWLHPRAVVAFDLAGRPGAGVELVNFKDRFNLSVVGYYDRAAKNAIGVVQLGYRVKLPLLDTSLSVGPNYSTTGRIGAGITLEVTR